MRLNELAPFWNAYVKAAMKHGPDVIEREDYQLLKKWRASYSGTGDCEALDDMLPEPFLGNIGRSREKPVLGLFLTLNPGGAVDEYQELSKISVFGAEIDELGYPEWAATWPYLTRGYCQDWGGPFWRRRVAFAGEILKRELDHTDVASFEAFPWHSKAWGRLDWNAARQSINELVLDPLEELANEGAAFVFAFGAIWEDMFHALHLEHVHAEDLCHSKRGKWSRRVSMFRMRYGTLVTVIVNRGYAGPPKPNHTCTLRIRELVMLHSSERSVKQ